MPCDPPLCCDLTGKADKIKITDVKITSLGGLKSKAKCAFVTEDKVKKNAEEEIKKEAKKPLKIECKDCTCEELEKYDEKNPKTKKIERDVTQYVTIDLAKQEATLVEKKADADCQIEFHASFELQLVGSIGICVPGVEKKAAPKENPKKEPD